MNELKIWIDGTRSLIYFKTNRNTAQEALDDFYDKCDRVGINCDNLCVSHVELQDEDCTDIDTLELE